MKALQVMNSKNEVKTGSVDQAKARYGLGRDTILRIAAEAGAIVRIGRRRVINFSKFDQYIDSISG